jgi:hypothetical protein
MPNLDRSEINRALSKAIAYKNCGCHDKAIVWGKKLIELMELGEILETR